MRDDRDLKVYPRKWVYQLSVLSGCTETSLDHRTLSILGHTIVPCKGEEVRSWREVVGKRGERERKGACLPEGTLYVP